MLLADCTDVCRLRVSINDDKNLADGNRAVVQSSKTKYSFLFPVKFW